MFRLTTSAEVITIVELRVSMVTFEVNQRQSVAIEATGDSDGDKVSAGFLVDRSASDVGNLSTCVTRS